MTIYLHENFNHKLPYKLDTINYTILFAYILRNVPDFGIFKFFRPSS